VKAKVIDFEAARSRMQIIAAMHEPVPEYEMDIDARKLGEITARNVIAEHEALRGRIIDKLRAELGEEGLREVLTTVLKETKR
jgi:hypothetical protein